MLYALSVLPKAAREGFILHKSPVIFSFLSPHNLPYRLFLHRNIHGFGQMRVHARAADKVFMTNRCPFCSVCGRMMSSICSTCSALSWLAPLLMGVISVDQPHHNLGLAHPVQGFSWKKRAEPACISATVRKDSELYAREQALCNFL